MAFYVAGHWKLLLPKPLCLRRNEDGHYRIQQKEASGDQRDGGEQRGEQQGIAAARGSDSTDTESSPSVLRSPLLNKRGRSASSSSSSSPASKRTRRRTEGRTEEQKEGEEQQLDDQEEDGRGGREEGAAEHVGQSPPQKRHRTLIEVD
jgi:hypothetical protein